MNTKACLSITAGLITCASAFAQSYSVWLPKEHELVVTPAYTFQMFDEFWAGGQKVKLPSYDYQHTMFLGFEYGLTEQIALDLTGGYTWVHTKAFGADNHDDGLEDTTFGVRYRILDEETSALPFMPSLGRRHYRGDIRPELPVLRRRRRFGCGSFTAGWQSDLSRFRSVW